jgi:hypothetical protein
MPKGKERPAAECHPDKPHFATGLCNSCYQKRRWHSPAEHARMKIVRANTKPQQRATVRRRIHSFTTADDRRFMAATHCDWCGLPFNGTLPHVDHDRRCCDSPQHCVKCTRGFVHRLCNQWAISYFEWVERTFGVTDEKLRAYRNKFPVPRVAGQKDPQERPVIRKAMNAKIKQ